MKFTFMLFTLMGAITIGSVASFAAATGVVRNTHDSAPAGFLDLPPDATGADYATFIRARGLRSYAPTLRASPDLQRVMDIGIRNLNWLQQINSHRPANDQLSFTSKENAVGYPLDQPFVYNEALILQRSNDLFAKLPSEMHQVLLEGAAYPDKPTTELKQYLFNGWSMDRLYQSAVRWTMMEPYLAYLAQRRFSDIRGFYFISKLPNRAEYLTQYKKLSVDAQKQAYEWMVELGLNNGMDESESTPLIDSAIKSETLNALFEKWAPSAAQIYAAYFAIPSGAARGDVTASATEFHIPFREPGTDPLRHFLADNIQDEWKMGPWKLVMDFTSSALAHLEFEAGAVPHVDGVGGNTITMDANSPLTEFGVQWAIRHEFGHVLGFPDCYLEFYDSGRKAVVSYQLDVTNLMCSRQGHLQSRHVEELKRVYGPK